MSYNYYRWKWDNYPRIGFVERVPIHLDLEVIGGICNYRCPFCPLSIDPFEPCEMPLDMARMIIHEFAEKGGHSIKYCYIGESLMYKSLPEVIKYAKDLGIMDNILATNGSLLTKELSMRLIDAGLDWITFSVDSSVPDIYQKLRVNGSLKIVARNIQEFYEIRNIMRIRTKKPKIVIQAIYQDLNKKEIDSGEYHKFWSPYCDEIRISRFEDYTNKEILPEDPDFFCTSPFRRLTIRADGKITLCCGERTEDKVFGDILKDSIEDIWLGPEFNLVRDLMLKGQAHKIKQCNPCSAFLNHIKGKSLKILNYDSRGDIF